MKTSSKYAVLQMRVRFDSGLRGTPQATDPMIPVKTQGGEVECVRASEIIEALATAVLLDVTGDDGLDSDTTDSTAIDGELTLEEALPPQALEALIRQLEAPEGLRLPPRPGDLSARQ